MIMAYSCPGSLLTSTASVTDWLDCPLHCLGYLREQRHLLADCTMDNQPRVVLGQKMSEKEL